jgi:hypothetical protein
LERTIVHTITVNGARRVMAVVRASVSPPSVPVATEYLVADDGIRSALVARVEEFAAAVPVHQRIALRLLTIDYGTVYRELTDWFGASEYRGVLTGVSSLYVRAAGLHWL